MSETIPFGGSADYYDVSLAQKEMDFRTCGHAHRSVESAVRCLQTIPGAVSIVAIWKRRDVIGKKRSHHYNGMESLTDSQVQALLRWQERNDANEGATDAPTPPAP
jgi:hypothetical protein